MYLAIIFLDEEEGGSRMGSGIDCIDLILLLRDCPVTKCLVVGGPLLGFSSATISDKLD